MLIAHSIPDTSRAVEAALRRKGEETEIETYPGCIHLIISLAEGDEPVLRGFRIPNRATIEKVPITVVEDAP